MRSTLAALVLVLAAAIPTTSSARSVLSPGELSVGVELIGALSFPKVSPSAGFLARYAISQDFAAFGELGFASRFQEGGNPPAFYAIGGGLQWNPVTSKYAAVLLRGGLSLIPREGDNGQVLGVRFYVGPGVEARLTDAFSLQFFTALMDLQIGGVSTDFDLSVMPSVGAFIYF